MQPAHRDCVDRDCRVDHVDRVDRVDPLGRDGLALRFCSNLSATGPAIAQPCP